MALVLFLDESGDHSLAKIDPQYPLFVLCGVIMEEGYHDTAATAELNAFKNKLFGREDIILHTADFTRDGRGFESMGDHKFRTRFFTELEAWVKKIDFKIVACVIRKEEHLQKYGVRALDPYMLSLSVLIERFIFECGAAGGSVIAESRGGTFDNALELAFLDLKIRGTGYLPATKVRKRIYNFTIREKKENITGLQLADVVATPIGRHVAGKKTYASYCSGGDFFSTVRTKLREGQRGEYHGMGLVVLPK